MIFSSILSLSTNQKNTAYNYIYLYIIILSLCCLVLADIADYHTLPKGSNPTLYDAANDLVIQLDDTTFNDTIFCSKRGKNCSSFIVEVEENLNFLLNI